MNRHIGLSSLEDSNLVVLQGGLYTNADSGGKRVRILKSTPGLIIKRYDEQAVVAVPSGETILVPASVCEKL